MSEPFSIDHLRFQKLFHESPYSIQILDLDGKTKMVNRAYQDLWELSDEFVRDFILKEYNILQDPLLVEKGIMPYIQRGFAGELVHVPAFLYEPNKAGFDSRPRLAGGVIYPLFDETNTLREIMLIHHDVTNAHHEKDRQALLAEVTAILLSTLDYSQTLDLLTKATIPRFADGCIVDIIENKQIKRLITNHVDPRIKKIMEELQQKFPPSIDSPQPSPVVIHSGKAHLMKVVSHDVIDEHTLNADHFALIKSSGIHSHIAIPLIYQGETLGAINFWITSERTPFNESDLDTALQIGHSAAMALVNAKLFQKSQAAVKVREDFISIASHELRTPITSLKLQAEILNRSLGKDGTALPDPQVLKRVAEATNRQLDRLTRLVDDMLDISRIANGHLLRQKELCDISALVLEAVDRFKEQFSVQRMNVKVNVQKDVILKCDPIRLDQVIVNLVTNALKYGDSKPLEITLKKNETDVILEVKDSGIGIAEENLERIFLAFERASPGHDTNGLGLGLFITRQIVKEHGGKISVMSKLGLGSTFVVELPIAGN